MFSIPVPSRPDRCELCRFSTSDSRTRPLPYGALPGLSYNPMDTYEVLVCKRMPPSANADGTGVSPVVWAGDYCGEFKVKP
jgi:hypothetical protein